MKKMLFTMAIAMTALTQINAQETNAPANRPEPLTPEQRTERHVQMLTDKLSLTDAQKAQLSTLYTDFDQARQAQEKAAREAREKLDADVLALLTADQQTTYKELQAQHQKGARHRHHADRPNGNKDGHKGGAPNLLQMADFRIHLLEEKLSLTDNQKTQIKALYTNLDAQLTADRDAGKQKPDHDAFRKTMDQLDSDIKALLTPDQQTAFTQFLRDEAAARHNARPERPRDCKKG